MEIHSRMPKQVIVLHVPTKQRPTAFRNHTPNTNNVKFRSAAKTPHVKKKSIISVKRYIADANKHAWRYEFG